MILKKAMSKKVIAIVISVVVAIGGIGVGITYIINGNNQEDVFVSREREYVVRKGNLSVGTNGTGTIKFNEVEHNFKESVTLEEVYVKEGQVVKKGDKLATISLASIEENIKALSKELDTAIAALNSAKNNKQSTTLSQNKAISDVIEASKSQYENSKKTINSNINNINSKITSINSKLEEVNDKINSLLEDSENNADIILTLKQNQEDLNREKEALQDQLRTANTELADLETTRKNELDKESKDANANKEINNLALADLDNSISLAQKEVDRINEEIEKVNKLKEDSTLYAEADGVILEVGAKSGAVTAPEVPIVIIGESEKVQAVVTIAQKDITKINEGQQVSLNIDAFQDDKFQGTVKFINLKPDTQGTTATYSVIIEIDKNEAELLDGMTVTAQFIIKEVNDVLTLSNRAIAIKDGKQIVNLKCEDGTTKEVEITTGFSDGKNSEIISGLSEGDTVIVGGE